MSDINERIRDQSHWFGEGRWGRERWLAYGDFFFALAVRRLREAAGPDWETGLAAKTVLEWGCGGGAIVRPLCARFGMVYGLDISAATLRECRKRVRDFTGGKSGGAEGGKAEATSAVAGAAAETPIPGSPHSRGDAGSGFGSSCAGVRRFHHFYRCFQTLPFPRLHPPGAAGDGEAAATGRVLLSDRYFDGKEKYRSRPGLCPKRHHHDLLHGGRICRRVAAAGLTVVHRQRDGDGEEECHSTIC